MSERIIPASVDADEVERTILRLAAARGPAKTICPSEAARALGGDHPDGWGPLMPMVRRAAVKLMKAGQVTILRKGRPVDPDDFKGIYRIAVAEVPSEDGEGNNALVRPVRR